MDIKSNSNTRNGDNSKRKKARVLILVRNTSSVLHFSQVSSKYSEGCYRADIKSNSNTKQEDHDGPISLTWANRFAYLLFKFQPSSLLEDFCINFIALPPSGHVF